MEVAAKGRGRTRCSANAYVLGGQQARRCPRVYGGACAHLFRHIISAGEVGGILIGAVEEVMASFLELSAGAREGNNWASCASPSVPSSAGFFCLFFFLVMLERIEREQQLGGERRVRYRV